MTEAERREALEAIATEIRTCTRCRLHQQRTHAVPGEGSPETEVVFVGEGPGFNEDQQGRPFVGRAGELLDELLALIGWPRGDVFITNVVKCRPPGNRDPEPDEIAACAPYLRRQLELLDPAVVVSLGRYSLGTFMPGARISTAHGTTRPAPPESGAAGATAFALYHPAAALRQAALKETLIIDMTELPHVLVEARTARGAGLGEVATTSPLAGALGPEREAPTPPMPEQATEAQAAAAAEQMTEAPAPDAPAASGPTRPEAPESAPSPGPAPTGPAATVQSLPDASASGATPPRPENAPAWPAGPEAATDSQAATPPYPLPPDASTDADAAQMTLF